MVTALVLLSMAVAAFGLAWLIIKPEPGVRATLFGMVLLLLLIAGQFVGYKYVSPRAQALFAGPSLAAQPLFRTIRKYEPALYERLERGYKAAIKTGNEDLFLQTAIGEVGTMAQKHLPKASDQSVNDFMRHALLQLKELQRKPGDNCYRFLFPLVSGPADLSGLPKPMLAANATYLEAVLLSALEHPQQQMPSEQQSMATLQPILMRMAQTYGQDLQLLGKAGGSELERRRVCEISVDLYEQILALPGDQSANVLRYMISKA